MRTNLARFPFIKGLDSFDFGYQPSVDRKQIQKLSLCHFVEHGENLVLLGPPGVGKTHLAVGLGRKAIEQGYRVLFTTAAAMLTTLTKALSDGRVDDKLKVFTIPRLLIIDEIGYLPIDRQAATLFFQLISRRYERGPMILTSNQSFGRWGDVFGDRVIASAILDRILHHATTISIRGDSYRLKDKLGGVAGVCRGGGVASRGPAVGVAVSGFRPPGVVPPVQASRPTAPPARPYYAVVRRTRRRGGTVRGAAVRVGWGRPPRGVACACCSR